MFPHRTIFQVRRAQPWIGVCVILGMLGSAVPFPVVSVDVGVKDLSTPFPCSRHRCGCRSAEQCWKQCCCFTNSEKVAWARVHGVEVPDFVVTASKREAGTEPPSRGEKSSSHRTCCHSGAGHSCAADAERSEGKNSRMSGKGRVPTQGLVISDALKCQGLSWHWVALPVSDQRKPAVLVVPPVVSTTLVPMPDWRHAQAEIQPPVPPPRAQRDPAHLV